MSDDNGTFHLTLPEDSYTIIASYVGYKTKEIYIDLNSDKNLEIKLEEEESQIDEVTVTGRKKFNGNLELGRNISTLDSKKIGSLNTNNANDILQATMPGVWSSNTSGAPGDHQKVVIRGLNTLFGCTDPLYVVDGVAVPIVNLHSMGIADLNVHDIENITVLKDASSTSLYGYQGGNGVIIIDTKKFKNESSINFSTKFGIQQVPKKLDLMNTKDFLDALDSANIMRISKIRQFYPAYSPNLEDKDWQDVIFKNGIIHEYQLSGTGKFLNNRFTVSGNYYDHKGIINNSNYSRYSLFTNVNRNITSKLQISVNYRTSLQKNKNNINMYMGNTNIIDVINLSPLKGSTPDSFYNDPPHPSNPELYPNMKQAVRTFLQYRNFGDRITADALLNAENTLDAVSHTGNIELKYYLNQNLFINGNSSITFKNNKFSSVGYGYMKSDENYLLFNQALNLNFFKSVGNNEFLFVTGYRNYADNAYWSLDSLSSSANYSSLLNNSLAINGNTGSVSRFIQSFSGHLNYNYHKKYFVSLVANYENLKIDNKNVGSTLFPSVALIWDISKELGVNQLLWLNQLNVFVNWGITGNYPLNALAHDFYKTNEYYYPDTTIEGKTIVQLANHDLKQEKITEYNVGTEIKLFDNRVTLRGDYFIKKNTNLIVNRDIPAYYGGGKMFINIGELENKGIEVSLEANIINTKNFGWTTNFAISSNKQRVLKIGEQKMLEYYNNDLLIPGFEVRENEEIGVIKGYKYFGPWTDEDTKMLDSLGSSYPYVKNTGGKYFKNHVSNDMLSDSDKVALGKSIPDYTFHWANSFSYKNFTLDMVWYGVVGVYKYNATKASTYIAGTNSGVKDVLLDKNKTITSQAFYRSSFFVEDASFIRLKQVTLTYSIPRKIYNLAYMTLSLSFENLFTITKYTGYDPEASIYTDNSFSDFAVDRGAYPIPRSMFMTLNLKF